MKVVATDLEAATNTDTERNGWSSDDRIMYPNYKPSDSCSQHQKPILNEKRVGWPAIRM